MQYKGRDDMMYAESKMSKSVANEIEYREIPQSDLAKIVWAAQKSVCQVETLDSYSVKHDDPVYRAFIQGVKPSEKDLEGYKFWFEQVSQAIKRGVNASRIHLISDKETEYLKYEIEYGYRQWCMPFGEKVHLLKRSENPEVSKLAFRDFYVIDDLRVLAPIYDKANQYIGLSEVTNQVGIDYFVSTKDKLIAASSPLSLKGSVW
jgi:hypothetical protein